MAVSIGSGLPQEFVSVTKPAKTKRMEIIRLKPMNIAGTEQLKLIVVKLCILNTSFYKVILSFSQVDASVNRRCYFTKTDMVANISR